MALYICIYICDTLTTPLVAQVVRRHKIINARLTCTGVVAVWGAAAWSTCGGPWRSAGRMLDADSWHLLLLDADSWHLFLLDADSWHVFCSVCLCDSWEGCDACRICLSVCSQSAALTHCSDGWRMYCSPAVCQQ